MIIKFYFYKCAESKILDFKILDLKKKNNLPENGICEDMREYLYDKAGVSSWCYA